MKGILKRFFSRKVLEAKASAPSSEQFYEPRWVWDVYGTGFPPPVKPPCMAAFERDLWTLRPPTHIVSADVYDAIKEYLTALDLHTGRAPRRHEVLVFWTPVGRVELIKGQASPSASPLQEASLASSLLSDSESPEPPLEKAYVNRSDRTALEFGKKG